MAEMTVSEVIVTEEQKLMGSRKMNSTGQKRVRMTSVSSSGLGRAAPSTATAKYKLQSAGTGRTPASTSTASAVKTQMIVSIVEGRGAAKGEIGMASMDIRHPHLMLSQFPDTAAYHRLRIKLHVFQPVEILVPETAMENGSSGMGAVIELLQVDFPHTQISSVDRRFFNDRRGLELIHLLKTPECADIHKNLVEKYYCLAATSALIKYVEFIQNIVFAHSSVKISFSGVENSCMIDAGTMRHLELIAPLKSRGAAIDKKSSLYGQMNYASTGCGARMLRASLLQPPTDIETIENRLDAIEELMSTQSMFQALRGLMHRMIDVEQVVSLCVHQNREETLRTAEYNLNQVIYLKHTLELVDPLRQTLNGAKSQVFRAFKDSLLRDNRFKAIVDKISEVIKPSAHYRKGALNMRTQRCFAVMDGLNGMLDMARRTYLELVDDLTTSTEEEVSKDGYPLGLMYSAGRGFHLIMTAKTANNINLPSQYIDVTVSRDTITCTTRNLIKFNDRIDQSVSEMMLLSNELVLRLLSELRQYVGCLYNLTEVLAVTDMLTSIAQFCSLVPSVRPRFTDVMVVREGRHALMERLLQQRLIPNDTFASPESNMTIITGPNMAGKSTYLKQVAVLQLLAQAGCLVPAQYASFRICKQIFSRIGTNDDVENSSSAFMVEMKDTSYILHNVSENSLVIIDELGRSTAAEEGIGLCYAICEHLLRSRAFVFVATHFLDLTALDATYGNVQNIHFEVDIAELTAAESQKSQLLPMNHKIKKGPYRGPLYGLEIAEASMLPTQVLAEARQLAAKLCHQTQTRRVDDSALRQERARFRLQQRLCRVLPTAHLIDSHKLINYFKMLKNSYIQDTQSYY